MQVVLVLAVLVGVALAEPVPAAAPTYGYLEKYAVPLAEDIRKAEESNAPGRIFNGQLANLGQFPYQAGLILEILGVAGNGVCGGVLVNPSRVLTAAHCLNDGIFLVWRVTVVLGTTTLFTGGGTRVQSSDFTVHPDWFPVFARNDIAVIRLHQNIQISDTVAPVALPSGTQLNELFVGESAVATGYGRVRQSEATTTDNAILRWTQVPIISNAECAQHYPLMITNGNICVSTTGGSSTCQGDSGGPLVITRSNQPLAVALTSFMHIEGCESARPGVFAAINGHIDFIWQHL